MKVGRLAAVLFFAGVGSAGLSVPCGGPVLAACSSASCASSLAIISRICSRLGAFGTLMRYVRYARIAASLSPSWRWHCEMLNSSPGSSRFR